jgi:hypothetical protein
MCEEYRKRYAAKARYNTAKYCQFLKLLLNDEVHSLTLQELPVDCRPEMKCTTDALKCMANKCPDMQKLVFKDPYWSLHLYIHRMAFS